MSIYENSNQQNRKYASFGQKIENIIDEKVQFETK